MNGTKKQESGFSYIDVMIAITILLVGVLALVSAITSGIAMTTKSHDALTAKQMASSTVESIYAARDLPSTVAPPRVALGWAAIGNVGNAAIPGAIFLAGRQPIYPSAGNDGIFGTADDLAGPDGVIGTADDGQAIPLLQREIRVTDIIDPDRPNSPITLRQIDVIIYYSVGSLARQETFTSYIANYRVSQG
jgi:hypothetical protein